jgi:hypothetical protein
VFSTHKELHETLTASGTFSALYTAAHASTPPLSAHAHEAIGGYPVAGITFHDNQRNHQATTSGSVIVVPDTGAVTVRSYHVPHSRWYTALDHLGTVRVDHSNDLPARPVWTFKPGIRHKPGVLLGHLQPGAHTEAQTLIERDKTNDEHSNTMLLLTPTSRGACPATWALAATFFTALVTGAPATNSVPVIAH